MSPRQKAGQSDCPPPRLEGLCCLYRTYILRYGPLKLFNCGVCHSEVGLDHLSFERCHFQRDKTRVLLKGKFTGRNEFAIHNSDRRALRNELHPILGIRSTPLPVGWTTTGTTRRFRLGIDGRRARSPLLTTVFPFVVSLTLFLSVS